MKHVRISALAIAGMLVIFAGGGGTQAADLGIKAFFGKFEGGGVAENTDSLYFGVTARDFDVEIQPASQGFSVTWTSVIRDGSVPGKPESRRKTSTRTFAPSTRPGIWEAAQSKDPVNGGELSWARISDNTLTVFLMSVRDDGVYELQQYDRKIVPTGMELVFTRLRDRDTVRTVKGRLVKVGR
jgi:hypothetical protein